MSINHLPSGALAQIFYYYTTIDAPNPYELPRIITITSVCRYWRHLASTTPHFWDNIRVPFRFLGSPSQWTSRWLQLSYPLGISVYLELDLDPIADVGSPTRVRGGWEAGNRERGGQVPAPARAIDRETRLRTELHRVLALLVERENLPRLLRLQVLASPNVRLPPTDALAPLQAVAAPNLRELEVSFMNRAQDIAQRVIMVTPAATPSPTSPFAPFSSSRPSNTASVIPFPFQAIPNVTALALQGFPRIPYPLSNLTSLLLSNILPTETAFHSLSRDSPSLHTLVLHNLHSSIHDGGNEVVSQMVFGKLKKLVVGYAKEPSVPSQNQYPDRHFHVIPYVVAPMIEEMEIGYEDVQLQYVPDLTRMAPAPYGVASGLRSPTGPGIGFGGNFGSRRRLRVRLDYSRLLVSDWSVKESLTGEYFRNLESAGTPVDSVEVALPRRPDTGLSKIVRVDWRNGRSLRGKVDHAFQ
ncbi:hypothetical protein V5O48_008088 [Marasmius crinis-equi]|uniref:F-box domain-containing protein n=1 Tax=Marasmius crinis-equi TaxID=585013 RepID=A0ABR3FEZ8_9AGAR